MNLNYFCSQEQSRFINSMAAYPAFVGGFGSGKTDCHVVRLVRKKIQQPHLNVAFYLPTYDLVDIIGIPRFESELKRCGIKFKTNISRKYIIVTHKKKKGKIYFRTLDKPERIVGYEVADSGVDELDTLKEDKARLCWEKIIARNRQKKNNGEQNTVSVSTTPEGFRFVYRQWGLNPTPSYEIIKAPTHSNARNLPADYIDKLKESYPSQLLDAYINGEFVNLTSGTVYCDFDRELNSCADVWNGEPVHIGMDFNVNNMSAVCHIYKGEYPRAINEITGVRDTPHMIQTIREIYGVDNVTIYPDASGRASKSVNASISDISLLKQAGLGVSAARSNPRVRDRIVSMNAMFCNANKERRYLVNTNECPEYTRSLEQQAYNKNGEPDKASGFDHLPDAGGYFIYRNHPAKSKAEVRIR